MFSLVPLLIMERVKQVFAVGLRDAVGLTKEAVTMKRPLKIYIADDEPVCRIALRMSLQYSTTNEVVGEAMSGRQVIPDILRLKPDVAIVDLSLPAMNGFEIFRQLSSSSVATKVIFWTAHTEAEVVREAMAVGVHGFIEKGASVAEIEEALACVMDGKRWLDPQLGAHL